MARANCPTEYQEQVTLAKYLDYKLPPNKWFHVPNGGNRNAVTGAKMKAQGTKKGVLDVWIIKSPPNKPEKKGLVIELKRQKGGSLSAEQKKWIQSLIHEGYEACVCCGAGEAIKLIEELGY